MSSPLTIHQKQVLMNLHKKGVKSKWCIDKNTGDALLRKGYVEKADEHGRYKLSATGLRYVMTGEQDTGE